MAALSSVLNEISGAIFLSPKDFFLPLLFELRNGASRIQFQILIFPIFTQSMKMWCYNLMSKSKMSKDKMFEKITENDELV
jgi:hypothetical protein